MVYDMINHKGVSMSNMSNQTSNLDDKDKGYSLSEWLLLNSWIGEEEKKEMEIKT